jgi:hypothetical protein
LYWLWERLPAAKLNDRGWKPLPQGFVYGNLDFADKHQKFLSSKNSRGITFSMKLTQSAFRHARLKTAEWTDKVQSLAVRRLGKWTCRRYWHHQNKSAAMPV